MLLDPGEFYILASKDAVEIPVMQAAEMTPIDPAVGEFRVHYAGFFDPGFGTAEAGGLGSRGVLEVRSHETPFLLEDGQTVARLVFEPLTERSARLYGAGGSAPGAESASYPAYQGLGDGSEKTSTAKVPRFGIAALGARKSYAGEVEPSARPYTLPEEAGSKTADR